MKKNLTISVFTVLIFSVLSSVAFANTGVPSSISATYNADTGDLSTSGTYSSAPCDDRAVGFALFVNGADPTTGGAGSLDGDGTPTMHVLDLPCTESGSWEDNTHNLEEAPDNVCVVIYDVKLDNDGNPKKDDDVTPAGDKHNGDNSFENGNKTKDKDSYGEFDCVQPEIIQEPKCGDGIVNQISEQCDDGNNQNGDGCDVECQIEVLPGPFCGDGLVNQESEQCDDGNQNDNDGCSANCTIEEGPPNEIPEFTVIGGGIALLGAAGYALYRRRK